MPAVALIAEECGVMSQRAKQISGSFNPHRWMAEIFYRTDRASTIHAFEEIEDLDELIELGPDWHEIERIVITLNRPVVR
jgi:hypothetical protein